MCLMADRLFFTRNWRAQACEMARLTPRATNIQLVRTGLMGCHPSTVVEDLSRSWSFRHVAAWMLLALAMRLPAPEGWMPNVSGDVGSGFIVICTVHGQMKVLLDANGQPVPVEQPDDAPRGASLQSCVFAGLGGIAAPPPQPIAVAAPAFSGLIAIVFGQADLLPQRRHNPSEARGPPSA
jgi:hypothetical protein